VIELKLTSPIVKGNGPSALFLSYLLHGNIPTYDSVTHGPHPDPALHAKLSRYGNRPLFDAIESMRASEVLTEHFHAATYMSYSNQALPLNVLLDTLVQPGADTEIGGAKSRLRWSTDGRRRIGHVVLGSAKEAGGQWSEDPASTGTSGDIEALRLASLFFLCPLLIRDLGADPGGKLCGDVVAAGVLFSGTLSEEAWEGYALS